MGQLFRRGAVTIFAGLVGATLAWSGALAQGEPPGRVARLAFTNGTVSFHDDQQSGWTQAIVNTPLTTGDSLWTEPNARSEISLAGTRIRMEGASQLDMLALDDSQTRLQLAQGRLDIKTFAMDASQPYEVVTPRGTIRLLQQGDYYVEAGSTEDPTRLGVRSGAAQFQSPTGQTLAVRAGEVTEASGDAAAPQLRTIRTAPPAQPAHWASRDRQIVYDPPQYLSAGVTGYEDLNAYGDWINDGSYGRVWAPRAVPSGWAPYRTGHWSYVQPWGWTWIDEQPWGFAPYHYGRWANNGGRWVWVPPQRDVRPVYAPALVAFVGGLELAATLANRTSAPVGWFPLGPREVYVPPYTTNRDYYQRLNRSARIEERILEDRWQRAQRREAFVAGRDQALINQRFATVVPTTAFVRSQPVMRAALQVQPQAIARAPVAPVAAPPAPTASVVSASMTPPSPATVPGTPPPKAATAPASQPATPIDPKVEAEAKAKAEAELKTANVPVAKTAVADMPTLAKPAATEKPSAPGPKVATTQPRAATDDKSRFAAPALAPRQGAAPPELKGAITPAPQQPAKPGEPARQQQAAPQPQATPPAAPAPAPGQQQPGQQARPAEPPKQQATPPLPQPATPGPQQARPAEPSKQQAPPPLPQPQQAKPADAPNRSAPPHATPPQAQPQQARPEPPRPQPQAVPPPQQHQPAPQRQQEGRIQPAPQPQQQQQAAPPQRQAAPPPPPQPQQHAAPPQPAPQQRQAAPQPPPQPQRQAAPQPQHQAAPPQPRPPEQAQARPAPQQPQQQQRPAPQPNDKKDDGKK